MKITNSITLCLIAATILVCIPSLFKKKESHEVPFAMAMVLTNSISDGVSATNIVNWLNGQYEEYKFREAQEGHLIQWKIIHHYEP